MNQTQIKYAQTRATAIFNARKADLPRKFTTPGVKLTDAEIVLALQAGRFTVKDAQAIGRYSYIRDFLDFGETKDVVDEPAYEAAKVSLRLAYDTLMDQLMLGDAEEALALIAAFEKE